MATDKPAPVRDCRTYTFAGWDPDGPYCAHAQVIAAGHSYGLRLGVPKLAAICPRPKLPFWEQHPKRK